MKILLVSSSSGSRGGGEVFLLYLGRALAQKGHRVVLWASDDSGMDELSNSFTSVGEVIRSRAHRPASGPVTALANHFALWREHRIAKEWRRSGADVIHINKQHLEDGLELLGAARLLGKPTLCTIHLTQSARLRGGPLPGLRDAIVQRALQQYPGLVVAVLERRWKELLAFLGVTPKVRLVATGVPLFDLALRPELRAEKRAELGLAADELLFLAVGRLSPQKRPLLFLEEAARIHQAEPRARFAWLGEGPLAAAWDEAVRARGLHTVARRLPWQIDVRPSLFAADVYVDVAESGGAPLALLEAFSAALPCAVSANFYDEIQLLNAGNSIRLDGGEGWRKAIEGPARLQQLSRAARSLAEIHFPLSRMAEHYETLYEVSRRRAA
ncbi:MAG TPA: glycosyltransferase [Chthoniobacteraceae bacterium]|jgi:glycosyltransferase involved in cell wall biosynthesis|nr:glycosyltransferase [Chthoniobacteraceae bacterium]